MSIDEVSAQNPPPPNRRALHDSMSIAYNYNRHDYGFQLWSVIRGSPSLSPSMAKDISSGPNAAHKVCNDETQQYNVCVSVIIETKLKIEGGECSGKP